MAMEIFKLVGSILVDSTEADKSLHKTDEAAQGVGKTFLEGVKKVGQFTAGVAAAAGAAAVAATKTYAEYEQLQGGIETMFGEDSEKVMKYANEAFRTAGLNANDYMDTVMGFSASLLQSLEGDTEAAAEAANQALIDMSDNSNKMGTDMSAIQNAYAGFAKSNYTMLDNLKLGYGGTKTEMERLLADAQKLSGVEYNIDNLNDVYSAIHVIQTEMGITGTTALEASTTISGATGSISAALDNMKGQLGESLAPVIQQLLTVVIDNLPLVQSMVDQIASPILGMITSIVPLVQELVTTLLPIMVSLFDSLLPLFSSVLDIIAELLPAAAEIVEVLLPIAVELIQALIPIMGPLLKLLNPLLEIATAIIVPLVKLTGEILTPLAGMIAKVATVLLDKLNPIFEKIAKFLDNNFAPALTKLKNKFKEVFEGIRDAIKGPINAIIGFINGLVQGVTSGVNIIIRAMNNLHFDIPEWVPGLGGKTFGFNLSELSAPQIPLLANGAVIEPNKPFAAVLGDQRSGVNVEAPISTIKDAVREVISEMGVNVTFKVEGDTANMFRAMQKEAKVYSNRTGREAFT